MIFTRKRLLGTAIALTFSIPAGALDVASNGMGQVLIYPYYTVNGGNQTVLTLANATDRIKAVRVRFREALNARPALEFNVYLGGRDVWAGAVTAADEHGAAVLYTRDASCTIPRLANNAATPFTATGYTGAASDHVGWSDPYYDSIERTREGLIEVIELGELQSGGEPGQMGDEVVPHTAQSCAQLDIAWNTPGAAWNINGALGIDVPTGGLYGAASVIDVADGTMLTYNATALSRFYTNTQSPGQLHRFKPPSELPDLRSADNGGGQVRVDLPSDDDNAATVESFPLATRTPDAVTLALMRHTLLGDFNTDPTLGAASEWVVALPTKYFYQYEASSGRAAPPFINPAPIEACEDYHPALYDRETGQSTLTWQLSDSPLPSPREFPPRFCDAVNVMAINQILPWRHEERVVSTDIVPTTAILGARRAHDIPSRDTSGQPLHQGQLELHFYSTNRQTIAREDYRLVAPSGRAYLGLPMLGVSVVRVINDNARPGVLASYGGANPLSWLPRRASP